jgi:hypothetical protein
MIRVVSEETTMLAEIFIMRLESRLRYEKDAAQAETPRHVPVPALPKQKG